MAKLVKKQQGNSTIQRREEDFLPNTLRIVEAAVSKKAINIKAYDVREITLLADSFIICSASSEPQMKAILNEVQSEMRKIGVRPLHIEVDIQGNWNLLDFGNVIFHVFREEAREYYDLDSLWGDAKEIELELEEDITG